jgi:hypothetical protein
VPALPPAEPPVLPPEPPRGALPPEPPVLPPLPVPPWPPEPLDVMHCPFEHVPAQAWLQPPQWARLLLVSTQALPHNICPAPEQPHTPLLQAFAPVGQALQPPQCAMVPSPLDGMHAPPEHMICPDGQLAMHWLLEQTWLVGQALQPPQCWASDATHEPLQRNRPAAQVHCPF